MEDLLIENAMEILHESTSIDNKCRILSGSWKTDKQQSSDLIS